jgi:prophage tail gpP-like protein
VATTSTSLPQYGATSADRVKDTAELRIDGRPYVGWTDVAISASIETACREATLTLTRPPDDARPTRISVPLGSSAEVWCRDDTGSGRRDRVLTGWADGLSPSYDARGWRLGVQCLSKTTDVVLSDPVDRFTFKDRSRWEIVSALCAPHGVDVILGDGVTDLARIGRFKVEASESVHTAADRVLSGAGLFLTDDAAGDLVIASAGPTVAGTALVLGENILSLSGSIDSSQRFSVYKCRGQRAGSDLDSGAAAAEVYGEASDSWQTRVRVLHVDEDRGMDAGQAKARAEFEAAQRAGRSVALTYTVQGWRQRPGGDLWAPNLRVRVSDAWLGIDAELLIVSVALTQDAMGQKASLTVSPVVGYQPRIVTPPARRPRRPAAPSGIYDDISGYMAALAGDVAKRAAGEALP